MSKEKKIYVGYGRRDITPPIPSPMTGAPADTRMSIENLTEMYVDALAFKDEEGTMVLAITVDHTAASAHISTEVRSALSEKLGIPTAAICLSSTHTHSAASAGLEWPYHDFMRDKIIEAGLEAAGDLAPSKMFGTIVKTKNMNFDRNYIMKDGSYGGTGWGDHSIGFAAHESEADPDLQLVKFAREGKKDVIIANFCAHPHREYNEPEYYHKVSANMPYVFRKELEEKLGCHVAYYTGASGNVNLNSKIPEENIAHDFWEHGHMMAEYALSGLGCFTEIPGGKVSFSQMDRSFPTNHSEDYLLEKAREVVAFHKETKDNKATKKFAQQHGIYNLIHARQIIIKSERPEEDMIPVQCFRVGELAFACMSGEPYDKLGRIIKDNSGYQMTFVLYISNVSTGYLPYEACFAHGGYGVYACRFAPGTGEKLAAAFVDDLQALHKE